MKTMQDAHEKSHITFSFSLKQAGVVAVVLFDGCEVVVGVVVGEFDGFEVVEVVGGGSGWPTVTKTVPGCVSLSALSRIIVIRLTSNVTQQEKITSASIQGR